MRISDWSSDVCSSDLCAVDERADEEADRAASVARFGSFAPGDEDGARPPRLHGLADRQSPVAGGPYYEPCRPCRSGAALGVRKNVESGKRVSVRVALGGRRIIKNKK